MKFTSWAGCIDTVVTVQCTVPNSATKQTVVLNNPIVSTTCLNSNTLTYLPSYLFVHCQGIININFILLLLAMSKMLKCLFVNA
jgi:hypothetical protein